MIHIDQKILLTTLIDTPLGCMVTIADHQALYLLEFVDRKGLEREIEKLRQKTKCVIVPGRTNIINLIEKELTQYFNGTLQIFTTPLYFSGSPFQQSVWRQLQNISYGTTQSYAQLAIAIGNPSACRAVANANGANQLSLIIPCHRVINSDGQLGGYNGGINRKTWLINHEKKLWIFMKKRCFGSHNQLYAQYHDEEWALPVHDDQHLFEMLILEGAQAGLSWETILKRRQGYRQAFHNFDVISVANMLDDELESLRNNPAIIRNRLKIYSTRSNAQVFLLIQKEFGSFDAYLWNFVNHAPIMHTRKTLSEVPVSTKESDALSKDLKKRGMKFVGSTIMYAYMQAVGLVNDHLVDCWLR